MVLLREIKRRKVLHTLSLYIVGCWVVLQAVDVLSEAGLPQETMRYALAAMSAGFPVVLLIAWFFDISAQGITRTAARGSDEDLPGLNLGDHALLLGIIVVLALNVWVLSSPPPVDPEGGGELHTIAVLAFNDGGSSEVGVAIAGELRSELTRFPGVTVLGPETSRAIREAGKSRDTLASELGVTSILMGDATLDEGVIKIRARVVSPSDGETVWTSDYSVPVRDGPQLHASMANAVLEFIFPGALADSGIESRAGIEGCEDVYEKYLLGRQLMTRNRARARELLAEATQQGPDCGIAWEARAISSVDWTEAGFSMAETAARRALELDENLAGAWAVLAEIAEEEERWNDSEWLFLKALKLDPSNSFLYSMYAEALLARGRVRESLNYALEGFRYEPASKRANFQASLSARYAGDAGLLRKHARIAADLSISELGQLSRWDDLAEAFIIEGRIDEAVALIEAHPDVFVDWYSQCVSSRDDPAQHEALLAKVRETRRQYHDGELEGALGQRMIWHVIRCATWIDEAGLVVEVLEAADLPTEQRFFLFFQPDSGVLRQTEHFRNLVVESGLLDYWQEWGFADACRPDGDSFVCD